jgi:hypothetical protein
VIETPNKFSNIFIDSPRNTKRCLIENKLQNLIKDESKKINNESDHISNEDTL